ncbi:non-specific lipid-transfer protein-like [Nilaparvata lugens]|uniref:non-specific lipid-transfer protein-like n=1 Tax=Nilaparvata lugens TaxID=108931 RepID=UPI00193DF74E|nr:non-specific lipid-transfer protein-like [Nilaparvata lugens]
MSPKPRVFVVGVGMTRFKKPDQRVGLDYPEMGGEAVSKALQDASGLAYDSIEQACVGYVYGDSTCGQRALYQLGMTGIPIYNVNNNCATGSTALILAKQLIESGNNDCVLALGFEKMQPGSLKPEFTDRTHPLDKHVEMMSETAGLDISPITAQMFGNAGLEHMQKYGTKPEHFAKIALKNHENSLNNPNSQFSHKTTLNSPYSPLKHGGYTLDEIQNSPKVFGPLTKLQCCPTSNGAAAAILTSEQFVLANNLTKSAVEILGIEMSTDLPSTFSEGSFIKMVGYDMTRNAAERLYRKTHTKPSDVDVVELHDCFSVNELLSYEALGLCAEGKAKDLIDAGLNKYGGKHVVNPSGGLIGKGHPLGATGLAQCAELCWQLRGVAGGRQVVDAKLALQHNMGLGGAAVVALYRLYRPNFSKPISKL